MDIYKEKFTSLQREILRFLFIKSGNSFNQRQLALALKVSPTAISKSLPALEKENLVKTSRREGDNRIIIELNKDYPKIFQLKRVENLKMLYESGLVEFLTEQFALTTIILFGSYAQGEDIETSDIDLAIIGSKEKKIDLEKYEKILERSVIINFYDNLKEIETNLKSNILNGITLKGGINLK
jgi:predicted nucleotidyltransferase